MDKLSPDVLEEIKKQVRQNEESLGIKVNVKKVSKGNVTFTIQLLLNLPYIEICSIDFTVKTPKGEIKTISNRGSNTKAIVKNNNNQSGMVLDPLELKVPYMVILGVIKEALTKGLQLEYELGLVVAVKRGSFFSSPKTTRVASKGKINFENNIDEMLKASSVDTKALVKVLLSKALFK